jgi:phosphate transport system ATP-binding protein
MPHISLRNLNVCYGRHNGLRDVTVDIPDERITAIIGPSGCGKTTLLKSLNRLIDLNEEVRVGGDVLIDGQNIYDPKADVLALRKKVGFLSQKPYPLPMSIYDNIAYGPRIHRMSQWQIIQQIEQLRQSPHLEQLSPQIERATTRTKRSDATDLLVECYLRMAGLWQEVRDRLHDPAAGLSVGQQQRLALARALAVEPEVILADEPTSALDPTSAQLIEQQFEFLKEQYTIIVVTHILRQARRIADYVLFLYLGELVEHGPAEQLFSAPADPRTRAYVLGDIS